MKSVETGKDKVKKICDALRKETLEPARVEAEGILEEAKAKRLEILEEARREIEEMKSSALSEITRERGVLEASMNLACRQSLESLQQKVMNELFQPGLAKVVEDGMKEKDVLAKLITTVVDAIEKQGLEVNLSAYIPASVPAEEVNKLLGKKILERLKEGSVLLSSMGGGIMVKLHEENITLDLSSEAVRELVATYIRKDFRQMIFAKEGK